MIESPSFLNVGRAELTNEIGRHLWMLRDFETISCHPPKVAACRPFAPSLGRTVTTN